MSTRAHQISQDAQGNLYVTGLSSSGHPAILVFGYHAQGNVKPIRVLSGSATTFNDPWNVTVDQATGKIFVVDDFYGDSTLLRFPPNANGNTAPFAQTSIDFTAIQIASDSSGHNIIYTNADQYADSPEYDGIITIPKQFPAATGINYAIGGLDAFGLADDPTTHTYLVSTGEGIIRLAEGTTGFGPFGPSGTFQLTPPLISQITSNKSAGQLAIRYLRNIYAVGGCANGPAICVYQPTADGDAKPLPVLTGPATKLYGAIGIYEGK